MSPGVGLGVLGNLGWYCDGIWGTSDGNWVNCPNGESAKGNEIEKGKKRKKKKKTRKRKENLNDGASPKTTVPECRIVTPTPTPLHN